MHIYIHLKTKNTPSGNPREAVEIREADGGLIATVPFSYTSPGQALQAYWQEQGSPENWPSPSNWRDGDGDILGPYTLTPSEFNRLTNEKFENRRVTRVI